MTVMELCRYAAEKDSTGCLYPKEFDFSVKAQKMKLPQ